jgi:hypothetical protein
MQERKGSWSIIFSPEMGLYSVFFGGDDDALNRFRRNHRGSEVTAAPLAPP